MYNILIVEDDKIQRDGLKMLLENTSSDYNIFTAATSKEGFNICMAVQIDLFILDVELPDVSGLDLACKIKKIKKYEFVWIIFITDFTQYIVSAFKRTKCSGN
jgi:two-component system LytT family response regulator